MLRLGMAVVLAYLVVLDLPEVSKPDSSCGWVVQQLEVLPVWQRTVPDVDRGCTAVLEG
jgi:hypothetical protein